MKLFEMGRKVEMGDGGAGPGIVPTSLGVISVSLHAGCLRNQSATTLDTLDSVSWIYLSERVSTDERNLFECTVLHGELCWALIAKDRVTARYSDTYNGNIHRLH